jgi:hypothetical protein
MKTEPVPRFHQPTLTLSQREKGLQILREPKHCAPFGI